MGHDFISITILTVNLWHVKMIILPMSTLKFLFVSLYLHPKGQQNIQHGKWFGSVANLNQHSLGSSQQ